MPPRLPPRRLGVLLPLGFVSGLPLALTGSTLQARLHEAGVDLKAIGLFALVGLPYTLKVLWAPALDRFTPPLGRRRGWMLAALAAGVAATLALGVVDPAGAALTIALAALALAVASATFDVAVDAWRAEALERRELGFGTSLHVLGYRVAMLTSGALALMLADHVPWSVVFALMAGTLAFGGLAVLAAPEPTDVRPPASLTAAVIEPLRDFAGRKGVLGIAAFVLLYKLGDTMAQALATPFLLELGFTKTDLGAVNKGVGLAAALVGTVVGGALLLRLRITTALLWFGVLQAVTNVLYALLAGAGPDMPLFIATVTAENFCGGMGNAAYAAFLLGLCRRGFAATQYAVLTAAMAFARTGASAGMGFVAEAAGWPLYFWVSFAVGLPALLLIHRLPADDPADTGTRA